MNLGLKIYNMLDELGKISQTKEGVTRLYLSEEHKESLSLLQSWMIENNLSTHIDDLGNLIGQYNCNIDNAPTLIMGSHQDSVKCGGKYDGALGVVLPIVCAGELIKQGNLKCNIKLIAFSDEEGVRFMSTYLGSKGVAGTFDYDLLNRTDTNGITLKQALIDFGLNPDNIASCKHTSNADGYLEVHIEQGPVLEDKNLPVGIVSAIQSSHRYEFVVDGVAGHAGTVPMYLRNDAMYIASKLISNIIDLVKTKENLVATVGTLQCLPGAANVIPSKVKFSLDIRCIDEDVIINTMSEIDTISKLLVDDYTDVSCSITQLNKVNATLCDEKIINKLETAISDNYIDVFKMPSGAGHDAQEMKNLCDIGMLFVRCKNGISHNPLESVSIDDIDVAANVVCSFISNF